MNRFNRHLGDKANRTWKWIGFKEMFKKDSGF